MPLRDQLNENLKAALKAREQDKLDALRLLLAAVKQREVDERITLDDGDHARVVERDALVDLALLHGRQQQAQRV